MTAPTRYTDLHAAGELARRAQTAYAQLAACELCARRCRVDRLADEIGECRIGRLARVASFGPHFGEEPPLVGRGGSGTIFFSGCNLHCVYCQNWDISQHAVGPELDANDLAARMLELAASGCANINLVSPTHVVPAILAALDIAAADGLDLPLVYNTGTYETLDTLRLLDGVVDVYLADTKYADAKIGKRLSGVAGYPAVMRAALVEMHRQVGDLVCDGSGLAVRGLMVRHLVLPNGIAGTDKTMRFIAEHVSCDTYVNVMAQYRPEYKAATYPEIARCPTRAEITEALSAARLAGLTRVVTA